LHNISKEQFDNEVVYGSSLAQITLAYNFLLDLEHKRTFLENQPQDKVSCEELILHELNATAFRMLVINYTVALIGKGKYDKTSIHNDPKYNQDSRLKDFYSKRKSDITYLKDMRNKIYAHIDLDAPESIDLERVYKLVKDAIILVTDVIGIENPKIKPR